MRNRVVLLVALSGLAVVGLGLAAVIWSALSSSSDCRDPRQDCENSETDLPLAEALQHFSLDVPCGTKDLRYAYSVAWNDGFQTLGLRTTTTAECLDTFIAQIAPSTTRLLKPSDPGFPTGTYPNGPYGPVRPDHAYRVITAHRPTRDVTILVDTSASAPVVDAFITGA